ncbi:transcription-repair coupling factor [Ligilactobacillus ruminis]|uniref:transcription-repair coupling factor n=1 Tax=Ligilactobacillus ruminis TaxID=1623 RepID=UPI00235F8BF2|nr:transcription-repair coupling factor [Ligilactobacillus ruminis]WDC79786.1 transcription-repair coupling factor [Ligilactobacillus ruminis]
MQLNELLSNTAEMTGFYDSLKEKGRHMITGVSGSVRTLLLADLEEKFQVPLIVVCDDLFHAQSLEEDLTNVFAEEDIDLFPVEENFAAAISASSPEYKAQRVKTLQKMADGSSKIVVTSVSGIRRMLCPKDFWLKSTIKFKLGEEIIPEKLKQELCTMGYRAVKMVERPGDFAVRGSIFDIYALNLENPVRIDLFDTEIDSLRLFDSTDQRSLKKIDEVEILPATDFIASDSMLEKGAAVLQKNVRDYLAKLDDEEDKKLLADNLRTVADNWHRGILEPEHVVFSEELYGKSKTSLFDYLSESGMIVFDDYKRLKEKDHELEKSDAQWILEKIEERKIYVKEALGFKISELEKKEQHERIFMSLLQKGMGRMRFVSLTDIKSRSVQKFFGQLPLLKVETLRYKRTNETVVFLISETERAKKMLQLLDDLGIKAIETNKDRIEQGAFQIVNGTLQQGFELPLSHLVVLTENELFAKVKKRHPRHQTMSNTERLKSYSDLKPGDFVVHVNHGIGRFMGMETLEVAGRHQDYMTIIYRDDAKLFIPVSQLDRIQKYVSSEGKVPKVNKLGSSEWEKTKRKVASKLEDIADELVELYSRRESEKGHAFPEDDSYQKEFEDAFPYTETPDQLRSAKEIKLDMEKEKPMDRLLIGDVGYGKTEVALRAAFKAVEDGKQVAFIAPTTLLVQQHYETMLSRFEGFPVEIGVLSRFSTPKQVKETLLKLKNGEIDIIVGTHRLLSKDVRFADLGLLIIDEEQRFGVKHKEKLKELKTSVDVLTLTATPIPRTLNMSMLGVRDLSVIETAPLNRYPIQTYAMEQNYDVVAAGIRREMSRGGQVFYLHNRVHDIETVVETLNTIVPEARIAYVHGQMSETQMEKILADFIAGEYDVLVTTTIIETGVDIPNVNTLFVEDADRMGLAQLYQLRGRVGRSNRVAYAYFMYQPDKVLTEDGEKRLEAIKDFTELGSGFKIAMRDLSIRGAGNMLGKQQHGFIESVGYDLYTKMLNEAVAKKRGIKPEQKTDCEINLNIEAYVPTEYIEDSRQKIEIYKRIHQLNGYAEYEEVQADLTDRFGDYPDECANLLEIGLLKFYADHAMIERITQYDRKIEILLSKKATEKLGLRELVASLDDCNLKSTFGEKNNQTLITLLCGDKTKETQLLYELQQIARKIAESLGNFPKKEEIKA